MAKALFETALGNRMLSYSYLMSPSGTGGGHYVELPESKFMELVRLLLVQVRVDERWYRDNNQDVDEAIRHGDLASARQHYITAGYFENRLPRPIAVDEPWYLAAYPDVAAAIAAGDFASATQHFERDGYREGRLPMADFSLLTAPTRRIAEPAEVA